MGTMGGLFLIFHPLYAMLSTITRKRPNSQVLFGAILVLIGILLLLHTTGVLPTRNLLLYTPTLFVLLGIWILVQSRLHNIFGPVFLIAVAGAIQLVVLGYATTGQVLVYWPILVIALGLSIALSQFRSRVRQADTEFSSAFAVLGSVDKRNISQSFAGGELTAIFGSSELDLRDSAIEDPPAQINTTVLFGDVSIIVPREWNVQMDVIPVLGDASDDRPRRESTHASVDLVVSGFVAFGDTTVTD